MTVEKYEGSYSEKAKQNKIYKVYLVLKDRAWHCRECEYDHVGTTQIAGSGGIKGLRNGSRERDGLEIKSENHECHKCQKQTRQDRWTGEFLDAIPVGTFPKQFSKRVLQLLDYKDVVEMAERNPSQLTIDHKLPRIRWNAASEKIQNDYQNMNDGDILKYFQLLKKSNGAVSHNLLKSRACERCVDTGLRGTPFGIRFFYRGGEHWEPEDEKNPEGCIGCGWYDFAEWRDQLNIWTELLWEESKKS